MRRRALLPCVLPVFLVACGMLGDTGIKIKVAGKDADFVQKFGYAYSTSMGANIISLANFEIPDFKNDSASHQKLKADSDGKMRVEIVLRIKGKKEDTTFETGEYAFRNWSGSNSGEKPDKEADKVEVYFPNGDKEKGELISHSGNEGTVTITSVTDEEVAGTVNIDGKSGTIKGKFTAKRFKSK